MQHLTKTICALSLLSMGMGAFAAGEKPAPAPMQHQMPGGAGMPAQGPGGMPGGMNMPQNQGGMPNMDMCKGMMDKGMGAGQMQEQRMRMMQEHMLSMQELTNKILATSNAKEKEKLKNQQLELMKAHKEQMQCMMGHGGGGMGGQQKPPQHHPK